MSMLDLVRDFFLDVFGGHVVRVECTECPFHLSEEEIAEMDDEEEAMGYLSQHSVATHHTGIRMWSKRWGFVRDCGTFERRS